MSQYLLDIPDPAPLTLYDDFQGLVSSATLHNDPIFMVLESIYPEPSGCDRPAHQPKMSPDDNETIFTAALALRCMQRVLENSRG